MFFVIYETISYYFLIFVAFFCIYDIIYIVYLKYNMISKGDHMKKALLLLLVATTFVFSACGAQKTNTATTKNTETKVSSEKNTTKSDLKETESTQSTQETKEAQASAGDVSIHFPATLMSNKTSSQGLSTVISAINAMGYHYTSTDNADGSKTLTMTKEDNEKVMKFISDSTLTQLKSAYATDSYPNYKDFTINDAYDTIDISTPATSQNDLSDSEKGALVMIESTGLIMEIFHGVSGDDLNFTVNFVNDSTNQTVYSVQSKDNSTFDILK